MRRRAFSVALGACLLASLLIVGIILASQLTQSGVRAPLGALASDQIRRAVLLSLGTATAASVLALLLAVPAAYALARYQVPGSGVLDVVLDLPIVLSPVALGVSWLLFFRTPSGQWFETHVARFVFEVPGIVLAQFTVALALSIRVLKAAFQAVDVRYEQVARFLGCTPAGAFWRVTLPMARRGVLAAFILAWARSVGEFGATVTLAGAVPGKTETIPVAIYLRLASADVSGAVGLILLLSLTGLLALAAVRLLGGTR